MYQKLIIIGNLGRDPEMRYTADGKAVTSFSVATSRKFRDTNETTWFRVSVWGNQAETCNTYLTKGSKVLIEGRLVPDMATGGPKLFQKKDGTWASGFDVYAENIRFLTPKSEGAGADSGEVAEDDIPF